MRYGKKEYSKVQLEKLAQVFIKKMNEMNDDSKETWDRPWFFKPNPKFFPQNISGRRYSGKNVIHLLLECFDYGYQTPIFLTFLQAQAIKVSIRKGEKSLPVFHRLVYYKNRITHDLISREQYSKLPEREQEQYVFCKSKNDYHVFNLEQTNYPDVYPEKWESYKATYVPSLEEKKEGLFTLPCMDQVIEAQTWVCPIRVRCSNSAYFHPGTDEIVIPLKGQFRNGESFYGMLFHEMAHSTGHKSRLARQVGSLFGSKKYAREELVAELTAALICFFLGFPAYIQENNIAYLKSWIDAMNKEPKFLIEVLNDVMIAYNYMQERLPFIQKLGVVKNEPEERVNDPAFIEESSVISIA